MNTATTKVRILTKKIGQDERMFRLGEEVEIGADWAAELIANGQAEEIDMSGKPKPKSDEGEITANVKSKDGTPVKNAADAAKTDG